MLASLYRGHTSQSLTIGILGGGQLAKMTAQAAYRMGLRVAIIEHGENSPAGTMASLEFTEGWFNSEQLEQFIHASDVVTLENEFIDPDILERIAERRPVFPTPATIRLVQDKLTQKQTFSAVGVPTAAFAALESVEDAVEFGRKHGFPYVQKTRKLGYDGYGNATVSNEKEAEVAWRNFTGGESPRQVMAEEFVRFSKELAVMVARNRRGEIAVYPCVETIQENHICRAVAAPAPIDVQWQTRAQSIAVECVKSIDGVGVFGVEMFLTQNGDILFNEIAPRPHNSGHYTIEACYCSQFENLVRAVNNLPLGSPDMIVPAAAMVNILGARPGVGVPDSVTDLLKFNKASLHLYGKKDSRKGRKMGHVTVVGNNTESVLQEAVSAVQSLLW